MLERPPTQPDESIPDESCLAMHRRLITWGRIEMRTGSGARQEWDSDSSRQFFAFTPREYSDAEHLTRLVLQLPMPQHRILIQEFYQDDDLATQWEDYTPYRRDAILLPGLARIVNARLRGMNERVPEQLRYRMVRPEDIDGIRWRGVRLLVNREDFVRNL